MSKTVIFIEGRRDDYSAMALVDRTMTVGQLIDVLNGYDEDTPVLLNNDNGYTFGMIDEDTISEDEVDEDEDEVDEDEED